jgi:hypothetical protein
MREREIIAIFFKNFFFLSWKNIIKKEKNKKFISKKKIFHEFKRKNNAFRDRFFFLSKNYIACF